MGTHLIVLGKSYPMNTNMIGFRWFSKIFGSLHKSNLSIGRVKHSCTSLSHEIYLHVRYIPKYVFL